MCRAMKETAATGPIGPLAEADATAAAKHDEVKSAPANRTEPSPNAAASCNIALFADMQSRLKVRSSTD